MIIGITFLYGWIIFYNSDRDATLLLTVAAAEVTFGDFEEIVSHI